jgi:hypothetical protein
LRGFFDNIKSSLQISDDEMGNIDKMMGGFKESISENVSNSFPMKTQYNSEIPTINPTINPTITPTIKTYSFWNIFKIILGIIIFAFLAFNIFIYLKTGSDAITYYFGNKKPNKFNMGAMKKEDAESSDSVFSALDLSAKNMSENEKSSDSKLRSIVENSLTGEKKENGDKKNADFFDKDDDKDGDKDDDKDGDKDDDKDGDAEENNDNEKDEEEKDPEKKYKVGKNYSASSLLDLKLTKTPGYCYVGDDRNVRTCVKVGIGDKCVSGKIFPTMDLCVNPNLKE